MKIIFIGLVFCITFTACNNKSDQLFEKISSSETHIEFTNTLTANEQLNGFTFTNFYNGGGVGIGDFNNDGLDDIFFTGNQVSSALYLNNGDLKFENITNKAGVVTDRWCNGVSVIDINNDGWEDLYISVASHTSMAQTKNLLYINQKTKVPSFKEMAADYGLDFEGYTTQSTFFDYDKDGDLDVFLLNTNPDYQNPSYLRPQVNDGTHPSTSKLYQNFAEKNNHPIYKDVSIQAGIKYEGLGLGVVVADYNKDSWPDIYCSNDFLSSDVLYLNNGDGTFDNVIKEAISHTSLSGMGVDAADINQDGMLDILQLDMLPESNARQKQMLIKPDYDKKELSINHPYNLQLQYMRNSLQVNLGNKNKIPQFSENGLLAGLAKTDWSWSVLLPDLDNDGLKDVFITNGYRKNVTDLDFINYYKSQDMFGDNATKAKNRLKLLEKVPEIPLKNYAYRNMNNLTYENVSKTWGLDELSYANGAAYADLDNDGDLDLVVNNIDKEASIFKNNSEKLSQNKGVSVVFEGNKGNINGIDAKLNVYINGSLRYFENQPTRGYLSSVSKKIMVGIGQYTKIDSLVVVWPNGATEKKVNLSNTKILLKQSEAKSIIEQSNTMKPYFEEKTSSVTFEHIASNFNDFNQTATLHKMLSKNGPAVTKADLNTDGLEDLIIGGTFLGTNTEIYFQKPTGSFVKSTEITTKSQMEVGEIHVFDSDGDNDLDLLLVGSGCERPLSVTEAYQPQLWLNDGRGEFSISKNLPNITLSSIAVESFDFDQDNDLDLFIGGRLLPNQYPQSPKSFILRNDKGVFKDITNQFAPFLNDLGMVTAVKAIDINNDKKQELVVVGEWMPLTIIKYMNGKFGFEQKELTHGWWNTIEAKDLNNDGNPDLVLGNEGLNSYYKASKDYPIVMIYNDFDKNGKIDPVMAQYVDNELVPVHPREILNLQINAFRKKYTTYEEFSKVLFDDLFTSNDKLGSQTKNAYLLTTCIGLNDGKGNFSLSQLPWQAQQAPVYSIVIDDINNDKKWDLVLAGNFYANEAHQGRQDASRGSVLLGNGKGKFEAISFEKSGLNLKGDIRKIIKINESNQLLAFANGSKVIAYKQNQSLPSFGKKAKQK